MSLLQNNQYKIEQNKNFFVRKRPNKKTLDFFFAHETTIIIKLNKNNTNDKNKSIFFIKKTGSHMGGQNATKNV